jgi:pyridinium-3,5-biscarboxylic acid mononucleotide sulfurtransferase
VWSNESIASKKYSTLGSFNSSVSTNKLLFSMTKYNQLLQYLRELGSCAVGFSGGSDSTFLLGVAKIALADKVIAFTIVSPHMAKWETQESIELAKKLNVKHFLIESPIIDKMRNNPENRCYHCKTAIYSIIKEEAEKLDIKHILDGTNADEIFGHRPGMKAITELKIKCPLLELSFTKDEIRRVSKELNLPTWDKPSNACLPSRLSYNSSVTELILDRIEQAEQFMKELGFKTVRVRTYGNIARIELEQSKIKHVFIKKLNYMIIEKFKTLGYSHISVDLEGYATGKMNY